MAGFESKRVHDNETSVARPGIASVGTEQSVATVLGWRGNQNSENLNFAFVGLNLGLEPKSTVHDNSRVAPALAYYHNSFRLAWIGSDSDRSINVARLDIQGTALSIVGQTKLGQTSEVSAAIAGSPDALFLAWAGRDGGHTINVARSTDGTNFSAPSIWSGHSSSRAPAIAFNQGRLFVAYTAPSSHIVIVEVDNPANPVPTFVKELDESSDYGPALAPFGAHLALGWTGQDGGRHLNVGEYDPSPGPSFFKDTFDDSSIDGPSLATRRVTQDPHSNVPAQDQLLIAWTGTDGAATLNTALVREINVP